MRCKGGVNCGVNCGINGGVNEQILEFITDNAGVNTKSILKQFPDIAPRTLERCIKELRKNGLIEFVGSAKTGGYVKKVIK